MTITAADLATARGLSLAVVDEYAAALAGARSPLGDALRALAAFVDRNTVHLHSLSYLGAGAYCSDVQLRGEGNAAQAVLWALAALDDPVATLVTTTQAVHVRVRGTFTGHAIEVTAMAYDAEAAAIREQCPVPLSTRPVEVDGRVLGELAAANTARPADPEVPR